MDGETLCLSRRRLLLGSLGVAGLGLLAGCGTLPRAEPRRIARIGHVWAGTPTPDQATGFRDQLGELGYVDGQSISIEERNAGGDWSLCPLS
jgi:hypothetical protein